MVEDMTDKLIEKIEEVVKLTCSTLSQDEKTLEDGKVRTYSSKNLIPREVRSLFKKKARVSKALKTVRTICVKLQNRIAEIDSKLKNSYNNRRILKEE